MEQMTDKVTEKMEGNVDLGFNPLLKKTKKKGSSKKETPQLTLDSARELIAGQARRSSQLSMSRFFTRELNSNGMKPLDAVSYVYSTSKIKDTDGRTVFEMKDVEVPAGWSQLAVDILVSKYFRKAGVAGTGHETSIRQVIHRLSHTIASAGLQMGYFSADASAMYEEELAYLLIHQMGAFNSPVWFNLGLSQEYGITGSGGNYAWDSVSMRIVEMKDAYVKPQCSACFIQAVDDDLMSIFQLVKNEARLFKYGSGTGTNFSKIRGQQEKLSGGGTSSGLMSFLDVFDKGAGATKSGGTTRRAAKMVCLDMDHPEIVDFITWKSREERKAKALIAAGYSSDFNGEAYKSIGGQNSNNSIRVNDEFMQAVEIGSKWNTRKRTSGEIIDTYEARVLWKMVAEAAWSCADPGVQYDTTINKWHTCSGTDRINASNPCSEYMFLDDSACNLSSLNLVKFMRRDGSFDIEAYRNAARTFVIAQEILVDASSYPTERIAKNSHDYRPLGLGYANLGTMLMLKGIPYDSDEGRAWAGALTAIMTGHAYAVSAEEAAVMGPFAGYPQNRESMLNVIRMHREFAYKIDETKVPKELVSAAREDWDRALSMGEKHGFRNAQVSVLAPTGTIGLLMDCDTTGIEPDFALVKFKKLAGGGYFKIVNQSVPLALKNLGYDDSQVRAILTHILGSMSFGEGSEAAPHINREFLRSKGLEESDIAKIEKTLAGTFEISSAFTRFTLGDELLKRIGVPAAEMEKPNFSFLRWAGLTDSQIEAAGEFICGTMTIEGAPQLKAEHLPVFDCANRCGKTGKRFIAPMGHVRMMAATQPFLSGAISKTVNVPNETTVEEIQDIYTQGWKLGLKAIALYRDGCKSSQPLSSKSESVTDKKSPSALQAASQADTQKTTTSVEATMTGPVWSPVRHKLPAKRQGFTQEAGVAGHKVYLRTGEYEDGTLGEVFIDMHKEGAAYRSMMNCFAISVSLGLQYGVPLKEFVDKFTFTRFEPSGIVDGHPNVKMATSIVDYIFRVLGMEYLGRTDFVQVKPAVDLTAEKGAASRVYPKAPVSQALVARETGASETSMSGHLAEMMGDAPPCDSCGHTTVRNGACYKCLNCGNSMGCS
ncbi:vitamin B12-dependent ribonucleotide reductase [Bdellovibrionota bacterium FG-2]